jgi:hypothetical protein
MTFGQDPVPATTAPEITPEAAAEIFELLKTRSLASAREVHGSKYPLQFFYAVEAEFKRLQQEFTSYMGGKLLEAEVSHFDEETGEKVVDSEAVYYVPTTETDLLAQVSSDLLDIKDVLNVIEPGGIWLDYKNSFKITE